MTSESRQPDHLQFWFRFAGIAGIIGALFWIAGDALIIGAKAQPSDYPLLLETYADRIAFGALDMMLPSSEARLAAGALIANLGIVFYLAGSWHLFRALRPAGPGLAWAVFVLLICGNAWSPLGHAAFYYVGMVYKTVLEVPEAAHGAMLALGAHFHRVLMIAWLLPIVTLGLALLLLAIAIARGGTAYPRWLALLFNPVTFLAIGAGLPHLLPEPLHTWLEGAGFNIGWLFVYGLSTVLLWRSPAIRSVEAAAP